MLCAINQLLASYQSRFLLSCLACLLVSFFCLFDTGSLSPSDSDLRTIIVSIIACSALSPSGPSFLHSGYALSVCPDSSSYGVPDLLS
ncbi:hypothetical protein Lal_00015649 [Lupinus albus]|uniref:Uncharacterized protein n=1 Tax=Lupinus albus TaxID=3870 RepID=A0A6A5L5T3_LUPAL|nr:hypothetical protein Lalb_Chr00c24g0406921 [Lupinus albus]KAF1855338.1 hypothetical protein Lal_00015649 [Lupinus albus]